MIFRGFTRTNEEGNVAGDQQEFMRGAAEAYGLRPCTECGGSGLLGEGPCPVCKGARFIGEHEVPREQVAGPTQENKTGEPEVTLVLVGPGMVEVRVRGRDHELAAQVKSLPQTPAFLDKAFARARKILKRAISGG